MISRHANKGIRSLRYQICRIGLAFVPQFHRASLPNRPDLQLFTSNNEPRLTNWGIWFKMLLIPTLLDLYDKPLFVFQRANYAPPSSCCLRRGDEQL
jgi:hypothetical protein